MKRAIQNSIVRTPRKIIEGVGLVVMKYFIVNGKTIRMGPI